MDEFCSCLTLLLAAGTVHLPEDLVIPIFTEWQQQKTRLEFVRGELVKRGLPHDLPTFRLEHDATHMHIRKALRYLLAKKRYEDYIAICSKAALIYSLHDNPADTYYLNLLTLIVTMKLKHFDEPSYRICRMMCHTYVNSRAAWNLFGVIVNRSLLMRHNKFTLRLLYQKPDHYVLCLFNGHNALTLGSHKHALAEYFYLLEENKEPKLKALLLLSITVAYAQIGLQKYTANRWMVVNHATAFGKEYLKERGTCQESLYNVGRLAHQFGMFNIAVHYYKKVLDTPPVPSDDGALDLSMEAAYNLTRIYLHSGNKHLATYYTSKYMAV